jgi:hypothetical protein
MWACVRRKLEARRTGLATRGYVAIPILMLEKTAVKDEKFCTSELQAPLQRGLAHGLALQNGLQRVLAQSGSGGWPTFRADLIPSFAKTAKDGAPTSYLAVDLL